MLGLKRRRAFAREPNGRVQREREFGAAQIRRLRDAAMRGLRDSEWGTELGRLYLERIITEEMYAAGKRWTEEASQYHASIGIFPIRTAQLQLGRGGKDADPDSAEGKKQASREANGAERFFEAHAVLVGAGPVASMAVRRLCEENQSLAGSKERIAARDGLSSLVAHYGLTRRE